MVGTAASEKLLTVITTRMLCESRYFNDPAAGGNTPQRNQLWATLLKGLMAMREAADKSERLGGARGVVRLPWLWIFCWVRVGFRLVAG